MPMSLGMITALAWQGDGLHLFLAAAGAAYLLLTLYAGIGQHKLLQQFWRQPVLQLLGPFEILLDNRFAGFVADLDRRVIFRRFH